MIKKIVAMRETKLKEPKIDRKDWPEEYLKGPFSTDIFYNKGTFSSLLYKAVADNNPLSISTLFCDKGTLETCVDLVMQSSLPFQGKAQAVRHLFYSFPDNVTSELVIDAIISIGRTNLPLNDKFDLLLTLASCIPDRLGSVFDDKIQPLRETIEKIETTKDQDTQNQCLPPLYLRVVEELLSCFIIEFLPHCTKSTQKYDFIHGLSSLIDPEASLRYIFDSIKTSKLRESEKTDCLAYLFSKFTGCLPSPFAA